MTQVRRQLIRAAPPRTLNALFSLERGTERQLGGANLKPDESDRIRLLRETEGRDNAFWNFANGSVETSSCSTGSSETIRPLTSRTSGSSSLPSGEGSLKVTAADFCDASGHCREFAVRC